MIILENNGVEISALDDAKLNYFLSDSRDRVVPGVLNDCQLIVEGSSLTIETGMFLIHGVRCKVDTPIRFSFTDSPAVTTTYQIVLTLTLNQGVFSVRIAPYPANSIALTQDNLFKTDSGTYMVELGTFVRPAGSTGIQSCKYTIPTGVEVPAGKEYVETRLQQVLGEILNGAY